MEMRTMEGELHPLNAGSLHRQRGSIVVRCCCHAPQAIDADQRHVDGSGSDHKPLVGANVGGGLGASDVLFARLQRQHKTGFALEIYSAANNTSRHLAYQCLLAANETEMGAAARSEEHTSELQSR